MRAAPGPGAGGRWEEAEARPGPPLLPAPRRSGLFKASAGNRRPPRPSPRCAQAHNPQPSSRISLRGGGGGRVESGSAARGLGRSREGAEDGRREGAGLGRLSGRGNMAAGCGPSGAQLALTAGCRTVVWFQLPFIPRLGAPRGRM